MLFTRSEAGTSLLELIGALVAGLIILGATLHGNGCESCKGTCFKGRLQLHELFVCSEEIIRLIQSKARTVEMLNMAMRDDLMTLVQDGIKKVLLGVTTYRQVRAVAKK